MPSKRRCGGLRAARRTRRSHRHRRNPGRRGAAEGDCGIHSPHGRQHGQAPHGHKRSQTHARRRTQGNGTPDRRRPGRTAQHDHRRAGHRQAHIHRGMLQRSWNRRSRRHGSLDRRRHGREGAEPRNTGNRRQLHGDMGHALRIAPRDVGGLRQPQIRRDAMVHRA